MQQYSIFFNHIPYSNQTLNEYKKTHPKRIAWKSRFIK